MRPKVIASDTETITFHVSSDSKDFLKQAAKKRERPFSELIREAIEKYIVELQQEVEIQQLRKSGEYKNVFSIYENALKTFDESKDFSGLDNFIDLGREKYESKLGKLPEIHPEVRKHLEDLKLAVARQYLLFHFRLIVWAEKTIEEEEKVRTTMEYIRPASSEIEEWGKKSRRKKSPKNIKEGGEIETNT